MGSVDSQTMNGPKPKGSHFEQSGHQDDSEISTLGQSRAPPNSMTPASTLVDDESSIKALGIAGNDPAEKQGTSEKTMEGGRVEGIRPELSMGRAIGLASTMVSIRYFVSQVNGKAYEGLPLKSTADDDILDDGVSLSRSPLHSG